MCVCVCVCMNVKRRNYFKKTKRKKSTHSSHASGRKCASFGVENALTGQHDEEETAAAAAAVAAAAARRAGTRRHHRGEESEAKGRSRRSKEKEKHGKRGGGIERRLQGCDRCVLSFQSVSSPPFLVLLFAVFIFYPAVSSLVASIPQFEVLS